MQLFVITYELILISGTKYQLMILKHKAKVHFFKLN